MTPERQRIAIAEACPEVLFVDPDKSVWWKAGFVAADPLSDLNVMHAVEEAWKDKTISKPDPQNPSVMLHGLSFVLQYHRQLALVTGAQNGAVFYPDIQWHATAAQRAEAFLRTIGKWE